MILTSIVHFKSVDFDINCTFQVGILAVLSQESNSITNSITFFHKDVASGLWTGDKLLCCSFNHRGKYGLQKVVIV